LGNALGDFFHKLIWSPWHEQHFHWNFALKKYF
jgi:hypothetical protein